MDMEIAVAECDGAQSKCFVDKEEEDEEGETDVDDEENRLAFVEEYLAVAGFYQADERLVLSIHGFLYYL